jgi:hypothetical protein
VHRKPGIGRRMVAVAGFLALAVVPVLALNSLARAEPGRAGHPGQPGPTDAQRECLAAHGVTPPTRPAAGTKPTPPPPLPPEVRRAAEAACGLPVPPSPPRGPRRPGGPGPRPGLI